MLNFLLQTKNIDQYIRTQDKCSLDISDKSLEEQVKILILRDLLRLDWNVNFDLFSQHFINNGKSLINQAFTIWRRVRDSNPGYPCGYT